MTREQAIEIATEYAKSQGWAIDAYSIKDIDTKRPECSVSFTGKGKKPGDHFTVYLECASGKVLRLMPGR